MIRWRLTQHPKEDGGDLIVELLKKYCEWLNMWTHDEKYNGPGYVHTYTPEQFVIDDPGNSLWGDTTVLAFQDIGSSSAFPRRLMHLSVSDGDDGGPSELTCIFEADNAGKWFLIHMLQHFDTGIQTIYDDTATTDTPWRNVP